MTRRDCLDIGKRGRPQYVKDLQKIGLPTPMIVIVDDNVDTISLNRLKGYSTVLARPFLGKRKDTELRDLLKTILLAVFGKTK